MRNSPSSRFSLHSQAQHYLHPHSHSPHSSQKKQSFSPYGQTNKVAEITFSNRIYAPQLGRQERQRRAQQPRYNFQKPPEEKKFQQRLEEVHSKLEEINALAHRLQRRMCITQTQKQLAKKKMQHKFSDYCYHKPARIPEESRFSPARQISRSRLRQARQRVHVKQTVPQAVYHTNKRLANHQSNQEKTVWQKRDQSGCPSPTLRDNHKERERRSASPMNQLSFKSRAGKKLAQRQNQCYN